MDVDLGPEVSKKDSSSNADGEEDIASTSEEQAKIRKISNVDKKNKSPGIIYLSSIPYFMTVKSIRRYFSRYGPLDRIFLQVESRVGASGKKERRYTEGWVEFKDKSLAKRIAASLNNTMVGGKRRSKSYECLWNIKYLSGFKWVHLNEQLTYEKAVHQQKLRAEISQAKREANYFSEQIDKGENLKKLEEQVLKKGGLWNQYMRQIKQKKGISEKKSSNRDQENGLLDMIFNKDAAESTNSKDD